MRIMAFAVFVTGLFIVVSGLQEFMGERGHVYGKEDRLEDGALSVDKPVLVAEKEEGNRDSIIEGDIIIKVDEYDEGQDSKQEDDSISEKDILTIADEFYEGPEKGSPENDNNTEMKGSDQNSLNSAMEYIKKGEKYEARNLLSRLYFHETDNENKNKIKTVLDKLNTELVFSMSPSRDAFFYVVEQGDSLGKIASKFGVTYKSIMRINNKTRSIIRVGERLKVLLGEISLLVDKSDFTLTMLLNGHYVKQYSVGIGKFDKTPEETFVVRDKLENPDWYSPDGVYKFGDPRNLLGTRWMGFEDKAGFFGYGIHGTKDPETIGKEMSNGCIRLKNEEVEELYDYVNIKTKVVIQK